MEQIIQTINALETITDEQKASFIQGLQNGNLTKEDRLEIIKHASYAQAKEELAQEHAKEILAIF